MITVHFTEQEAQMILQMLTKVPVAWEVSNPLITRVGVAMQQAQQEAGSVGQAAGAGSLMQQVPRPRPIPVPAREHHDGDE